ncbi:helix-turn-helix transcriptional regulator [Mesorhizobium sp. M0924]|uniref:winged helix-turn-helix transcriptional regulator n=1 Tax=unclassified Mesorhizobium TaxID=325217 RepID=UPI0009DE00C1|nr:MULTISPECIES: helix-turn-helix domain-containing protein [unclassified Mesorhizobium]WJI44563.1 helix-turn-helix transcriptional regulator [Mesorhizobium sp. C120A]WJI65339.1 helix-turn-helix transcriptional regulator [Mesorhizobium sp. C416B]
MTRRPYGLVCPISHACEFLEPRWTIQILTELWNGSTRFNDIRKGVGNVSSALLSRRLKDMEALGLVERVEDGATGAICYFRTQKSINLREAPWKARAVTVDSTIAGISVGWVAAPTVRGGTQCRSRLRSQGWGLTAPSYSGTARSTIR